jgi:stress-induced morphogen
VLKDWYRNLTLLDLLFLYFQLLDALEAEYVEVIDNSDGNCSGGAKLELLVVSKQFEGVGLLKRHQMVNGVLSAELKSEQIHALTMKTWTPEQYASKK